MPIGFQIMAPALSEALLFRAAQAVEDVSPSLGRPTLHEVAS
jgi:Asp-tRNA(Asn)/Glu-tRNA(Gln) amidotransferase A subunit family amidase